MIASSLRIHTKMLYILIIFTASMIFSMSDVGKMIAPKKESTNEKKTESDRSEPLNGTQHSRGSLRAVAMRDINEKSKHNVPRSTNSAVSKTAEPPELDDDYYSDIHCGNEKDYYHYHDGSVERYYGDDCVEMHSQYETVNNEYNRHNNDNNHSNIDDYYDDYYDYYYFPRYYFSDGFAEKAARYYQQQRGYDKIYYLRHHQLYHSQHYPPEDKREVARLHHKRTNGDEIKRASEDDFYHDEKNIVTQPPTALRRKRHLQTSTIHFKINPKHATEKKTVEEKKDKRNSATAAN